MKKVKLSEASEITSFLRTRDNFLMLDGNTIKKISKDKIENEPSQKYTALQLETGSEVETNFGGESGLFVLNTVSTGRVGLFSLHHLNREDLHVMISDGGGVITNKVSQAAGKILVYRKTDFGNVFIKNNNSTQTIILTKITSG